MQIPYNEKNIELNYLNNYVMFSLEENSLQLHNTLYNKTVVINGNIKYLKELIIYLQNGVTTNKLLELINNLTNNNVELYQYLLQNFIIE